MGRLRSWRLKIRVHWIAIGVVAIVLTMALALIIALVLLNGTGFGEYVKITTTSTLNGTTTTKDYQPGKTLWDWLQLLIIPFVLAAGGYLFTFTTNRNERKTADRHNQTERVIAQDNQREVALQAYIDKMSELLLEKQLRESKPEDEVRKIARVRTLTVFARLDGKRKRSLLLFLYDADLIDRGHQIIDLSGANLGEADLSEVDLCRPKWIRDSSNHWVGTSVSADLSGANLQKANLNGAVLFRAKLGADRLSLGMNRKTLVR
jgi:flagellar basal body-associated protein FliL